jgi:hypothetical protein
MAPKWSFLSNYGRVMVVLTRRPDLRLREIGGLVGITPRAAQTIVSVLVDAGFLERSREGRRNRYRVRGERPLPDPGAADHDVSDLIGALVARPGVVRREVRKRSAVVLGCSDHNFQEPMRDLLVSEGLGASADVVLWPGGAGALTGPEGNLLLRVLADQSHAERPSRVLLIAHESCSAWTSFDRPGDDPFANVRGIRSRRAWTIAAVAASLGVEPESWHLTDSGAFRVDQIRTPARAHTPRPDSSIAIGTSL